MSYTDSKIYQLGFQLAVRVEHSCRTFPKHEQFALAQQLRNASRSIAANYVEGYVRETRFPSDWRRFLIYAQGSCDETKYWLTLAKEIDLLDEAGLTESFGLCQEISRMLMKLIGTTRARSI